MLITILAGILMLIILVVVHEYGHLWAAQRCGVGVEEFSVGFGPGIKIFQTKTYPIYFRFIPLGGYVKLKTRDLKKPISQGKNYEDANWLQRIFICVAGIGFNLILAIIIRILMYNFAPPDTQIKFLTMTITFMQGPVWYLAPIQAIKAVFGLFIQFYVGVLISIWYMVMPIINLAPVPHGGIGGTIGLGANIHLGFWSYCGLIYFVSVILAALNLFPLLPFDGGQIVLSIFGRIFGEKSRAYKIIGLAVNYLGMVILIILLLNVVMSDLFDIFTKLKGG